MFRPGTWAIVVGLLGVGTGPSLAQYHNSAAGYPAQQQDQQQQMQQQQEYQRQMEQQRSWTPNP